MDRDVKHISRGHREAFCRSGAAEEWDHIAYGPNTYHSFIWESQRKVLEDIAGEIAETQPAMRYLDFACGTGRVLSALSPLAARDGGRCREEGAASNSTSR